MKNINDHDNNAGSGTSSTKQQNNGINNINKDPTLEEINRQAAILFKKKKYGLAVSKYSQLIEMCPNDAIFYGNRAASYIMLENYLEGLKDARKSVKLDPMFIKGHCRVLKCAMRLHKFREMDISVAKLKMIDPTNEVLHYQAKKIQELVVTLENETLANADKDYEKVLEYIDKSLEICPLFSVYKAKKAECLLNLGKFIEARSLAKEVLKQDPNNSNCHYVLGRCLHDINIEKSVHHFEEAFRLNPRCMKDRECYQSAKKFLERKTEANEAYRSRNFTQAHSEYSKLFSECAEDTGMKMTLYFNMAQASYKMGYLDRCLRECDQVFAFNSNHLRARMRRAQCYLDKREFVKALEELEKAWSIESSPEVLKMLQEAYKLLGASPDGSYVVLGVSHDASKEMITKTYKELTKLHHPDRHADATDEQKKYHEIKCKEITRAYRLLMESKPASAAENNNNNGSEGTNSSPGGQKNNSDKSYKQQSSAGDSYDHNGQEYSSGSTNNNFHGFESSSGGSSNHNGQKSSSAGANYNSTGPQSSNGGQGTNSAPKPPPGSSQSNSDKSYEQQSSAGDSHDHNGQKYSTGSTNNNFHGFESSSGSSNNQNGQKSSSAGANYNSGGSQSSNGGQGTNPAPGGSENNSDKSYEQQSSGYGFDDYTGQRFSYGNANGNSTGYQSYNDDNGPRFCRNCGYYMYFPRWYIYCARCGFYAS